MRRDEKRVSLPALITGAIRATVVDGRFVAAKPFEQDKYPHDRRPARSRPIINAARIRYPMVRVDFTQRSSCDTSQRGDNRFVRVSWDEALDLFYQELERVQNLRGRRATDGRRAAGNYRHVP